VKNGSGKRVKIRKSGDSMTKSGKQAKPKAKAEAPDATPAPARARPSGKPKTPPTSPPPHERVRIIREMMLQNEWVTGKTGVELAERWGLAEATVRGDAATASGEIKSSFGDKDQILTRCMTMIESAFEVAQLDPMPANAARAMVACAEKLAQISGAAAPVKVAATDTKGDDLPPMLRRLVDDPVLARFALENNRPPTEAEVEELRPRLPLAEAPAAPAGAP
jgi:hypothetical protein